MYNTELKKISLKDVTKDTFRDAIFCAYRDGITSVAPLGYSGDDFVLFGKFNYHSKPSRVSLVTVRNHSGNAELLITDKMGKFLFYGKFSIDLGVEFVANQFYKIFLTVKDQILQTLESVSDFKNIKYSPTCTTTEGFKMLKEYQKGVKNAPYSQN